MKPISIACQLAVVLSLAFAAPGLAATSLVVKNSGLTPVQIGFDQSPAQTIAPRATAAFTLNAGSHTAQCRFEGAFDGCNIQEQFNLAESQKVSLDLLPIYTLEHAVTLAQQGTLTVATRRDSVWATRAEDVPGNTAECTGYETGKLAGVSTKLRSGMTVGELALATQRLCGEARPVIATTIGGQKMYVQPNFLIFRDRSGRPILVRQ